jgi:catechol 2,3-dioxygenase-like lactoylglutathione lyase family enzyme
MKQRFQLALNVDDLDIAIDYYSRLFGAKLNKRKPGYANFSIDNPPLKLVLFENPNANERINHLGVENFDQSDVDEAIERFKTAGIADEEEVSATCCYARQNKIWSTDPSGTRWEWYRILENAESFDGPAVKAEAEELRTSCCSTG